MPELPDVVIYVERLREHVLDRQIERVRLASPFLLRTVDPPIAGVAGKRVVGIRRLGKRIVIELEGTLFLVLHLMIVGRLRWRRPNAPIPKGAGLGGFDFSHGTLIVTEAGKKKRASLHVVRGEPALEVFARGRVEVLESSPDAFVAALRRENHTLKRALTDPRILSGIGNAYSDEILHRARLSPFQQTKALTDEELARLRDATVATLTEWIDRLRAEVGDGFPEKVTAFREGMAVHGRYGKPCPVCGGPIQRIVYAAAECNYCPACQTGGRLLADRSLSRLLRGDWPKTLEALKARRSGG